MHFIYVLIAFPKLFSRGRWQAATFGPRLRVLPLRTRSPDMTNRNIVTKHNSSRMLLRWQQETAVKKVKIIGFGR